MLLIAISRVLGAGARLHKFVLPVSDGARLAWLHARGQVVAEDDAGDDERGPLRRIDVRLSERELGRFSSL